MNKRYPVIIVGAGPGDPELITVKGRKAITEADVIFYAGSLVNDDLLEYSRSQTARINTASMDLTAITNGMMEAHRDGKRVVRLHSGDPSLYGAIQEQIGILEENEIPYQVVPGVTAAFAAAAALGRELTVPEVTQTVILTRVEGRTPVPVQENLMSLAEHGCTIAIYLSIKKIHDVVEVLSGTYGPDAPVVVAYRVSWPDEKIIHGTVATIAQLVRKAGIDRQALILVGPNLALPPNHSRFRSKLYDEKFSHGFRESSKS